MPETDYYVFYRAKLERPPALDGHCVRVRTDSHEKAARKRASMILDKTNQAYNGAKLYVLGPAEGTLSDCCHDVVVFTLAFCLDVKQESGTNG